MNYLFDPPRLASVPVLGNEQHFPVHRIYCVGKNYADHIREMGSDPAREEPCFFMKPSDAIVLDGKVPYPQGTRNLHYEGELVLALGKGGRNLSPDAAASCLFGYATGLDMTRRDLQTAAGRIGMPWDTGKAFDHSAPMTAIVPLTQSGILLEGSLKLWVNGRLRQDADLGDMLWKPHEIISQLSRLYTLQAGDLIFTGTPAGVGPVVVGDKLRLEIAGLPVLEVEIV